MNFNSLFYNNILRTKDYLNANKFSLLKGKFSKFTVNSQNLKQIQRQQNTVMS